MSDDFADRRLGMTVTDDELVLAIGGHTVPAARALTIAGVALLLIAPAIFADFFVELLILSLLFSMFAISVDLVWGYAGILTFGHAAFYGFGAYIMAKLTTELTAAGISYLGIILAILLSGLAGLLIAGILFSRGIDAEYFTIITLAIAIIANQTAISWDTVTGGFNGIRNIPPLELGVPGLAMTPITGIPFYYLALGMLILVSALAYRLVRSPFGTALVAIAANETKASALGYNTAKYKMLVFGISAGIAGFAGALHASYSGFVSPPLLGFLFSTEVLIWVLIGGRGTIVGAIVGAIFLTLFENVISGALLFSWTLLLGIILIVIVLAFPRGVVGVFDLLGDRLERHLMGDRA